MQTAVKIWIWIFGCSGTKDVCEIYARPAAILRSFGSLRVSHCHCRATALTAAPWKKPLSLHLGSPKTKPKNPTPFWWPPFVACIAVTFLLQGLMNFIRLASNCRRFYGNSAPRHQIFGSWHPPDVWAKLFAQDDRKEIVCTMRCPQTTLIKKVLRLTTWVGSNTSMLACVWVHWGK